MEILSRFKNLPSTSTPTRFKGLSESSKKPTVLSTAIQTGKDIVSGGADTTGGVIRNTITGLPSAAKEVVTHPVKAAGILTKTFLPPVYERATAVKESIEQKSLDPLKKSFEEQYKRTFIQPGDTLEDIQEKATSMALAVAGGTGDISRQAAQNAAKEFAAQEARKLGTQAAEQAATKTLALGASRIPKTQEGMTVFRASEKPFDINLVGKEGVFVSPSENVAGFFSESGKRPVEKLSISPDARILEWKDIPDSLKDFNNKDLAEAQTLIKEYGEKMGYDLVTYEPKEGYPLGIEYQIINPKIIKKAVPEVVPEIEAASKAIIEPQKTVIPEKTGNLFGESVKKEIPEEIASPVVDIAQKASRTPNSAKVNVIDYLMRTPSKVLKKIGLSKNAEELSNSYRNYLVELPKNIEKITGWMKQTPSAESNVKIFRWLDGKGGELSPQEFKVASEIKSWLSEWANKLNLPEDKRISDYITHIFPQGAQGEIDEEVAKIIQESVPGSVYDPFTLKRTGQEGYLEDTWKALDAYVKRATRKVNMDEALKNLKESSKDLELSQFNYVKRLADRVNLRPTEFDSLIDNMVKNFVGYRFGARPVNQLSRSARKIVSRAKLGLNFKYSLKNLTQGVNTFSELGGEYTFIGYKDLFSRGFKEVKDSGVLLDTFIQDRELGAVEKFWQRADEGIFANFQVTELINRGAAYYGGKAKALAEGSSEEAARKYGREIADKTQFTFGPLDTPVALSSDILKTIFQFQTYSIKQIEFLAEKAGEKNIAGLVRYLASFALITWAIGNYLGSKYSDILPTIGFDYSTDIKGVPVPPSLDFPARVFNAVTGQKNDYGVTPSASARVKDVGKAFLTDIVPGGGQIRKTVQAITDYTKGKVTRSDKDFLYKVKQTPSNLIKGTLFGRQGFPETQAYYEKQEKSKTSSASSASRFKGL